ncbi:MAG: HD domain-containing protein [Armatimonadetes bacterium]|nr:HD domain-containing protein [Armatimonadota bacterium]
MFVEEKWWGLIGFDDCAAERVWSAAELDALKASAGIFGAAIQRKHAEERIQQQLQHVAALHQIDLAIASSLDLSVTLSIVLDQVTTQLHVDAANVLLMNSATQTLRFAANRGFRTRALQNADLRLGTGHAGRVALERQIATIPHLANQPNEFSRSAEFAREGFVAYAAAPLIAKGQVRGVLEVFRRETLDFDPEWLRYLETLAGQLAIAIDSHAMFNGLQRANTELMLAYDTTLEGWSKALDLRDKETEGHTLRVTEMTLRLARAMGMNEAELVHVRRGALLHDIGKMGIPDSILLKPGALTDEEWVIMRKHPVYAYELLSPISYLRPALDIPYAHHEKWDGSGYPRGLKGEPIPLAARIFAVIDVWDALTSDRPYRKAWPEAKARAHIREQAGKHFDPRVVEAFLALELEVGA